MADNLLIVESPSKAKTLKKYLGKDFEILASYGHVRGLVRKDGSVDVEHDFAMKYQIIAKNAKHVDAIISAAKAAKNVYLATDPDREGEAISWHLLEILNGKKALDDKLVKRVVFHEITESAVLAAVAHPRDVDAHLVNAQQARSALDYLVGFNLSPLLWRKVRSGLSAGRVQSPALRLICEREKEIRAFVSQEFWSIHLDSHKGRTKFGARLNEWRGKKLEQFDMPNEASQAEILKAIEGKPAAVTHVEKKRKSRNPTAPFTTSTMQQEAVRKLGMTTDKTMRTAQQLYEGIALADGTVGLITYMRTDSVALANEALAEIRAFIGNNFDAESLPAQPVTYKNKSKNAQEAHEAIRPTSILRTPASVKAFLSAEQFKLYEMIWKRTLASQMAPARFDTTSVDIAIGEAMFRASGQVLVFAGFLAVYEEDVDDAEDEEHAKLPPLEAGEEVPVDKLFGEQHFTQPPPRFSEASLVKALEEFGIGRPSTYASIIKTLKDREYVNLDKKRFLPTDTGEVVNKFLTDHFAQYVDYQFTSKLEDKLDEISNGDRDWIPVMQEFWTGFSNQIEEKKALKRSEVTHEALDEACPKCAKQLTVRLGKRGRFVGCTGYPECDYTRDMNETAEQKAEEAVQVIEDRVCPDDGGQLIIKTGRYGKFIGCANYPKCKHIEPLEKPKDTGVGCPVCKQGMLIERKSRYGKLFYSCNTYPKCTYATWNPPINEACSKCGWPVMTLKTTKRRGLEKVCPQKECGHTETVMTPEQLASQAESVE
ncbi:type I DNA topoisomerase [Chitinimonas sp. BJB300]|uniref:type I DNA topoisomerase n=1 Tax=Chitinimonas sp. BJB300 TaxID=1559339 RepID=UPI000C112DCB|nr:type I DNA topoisomerase [Chitinimonas sp. BJB300]PHV11140.1 DNA topoisomerase I [Chitinimonas sp. BJB300]TSJ90977.1 type I DNA topoisomerase [Chitinimonas sp. BJB300]